MYLAHMVHDIDAQCGSVPADLAKKRTGALSQWLSGSSCSALAHEDRLQKGQTAPQAQIMPETPDNQDWGSAPLPPHTHYQERGLLCQCRSCSLEVFLAFVWQCCAPCCCSCMATRSYQCNMVSSALYVLGQYG